jgi:hypothetical protein
VTLATHSLAIIALGSPPRIRGRGLGRTRRRPRALTGDQFRRFRRAKTAVRPPLRPISKGTFPSPRLLALDLEAVIVLALSRWRRQHRDPAQHRAKQPTRQITLREEQPVVPATPDQRAAVSSANAANAAVGGFSEDGSVDGLRRIKQQWWESAVAARLPGKVLARPHDAEHLSPAIRVNIEMVVLITLRSLGIGVPDAKPRSPTDPTDPSVPDPLDDADRPTVSSACSFKNIARLYFSAPIFIVSHHSCSRSLRIAAISRAWLTSTSGAQHRYFQELSSSSSAVACF